MLNLYKMICQLYRNKAGGLIFLNHIFQKYIKLNVKRTPWAHWLVFTLSNSQYRFVFLQQCYNNVFLTNTIVHFLINYLKMLFNIFSISLETNKSSTRKTMFTPINRKYQQSFPCTLNTGYQYCFNLHKFDGRKQYLTVFSYFFSDKE